MREQLPERFLDLKCHHLWESMKPKSWCIFKNLWDSDRWPLGFLSRHCIVAEGQSIHQAWEAVMELCLAGTPCVKHFNTHDTERRLGCPKRSQMWTQDKHCEFLSYCWVCQWNVTTGRTRWSAAQRQEDSTTHGFWDFLCDGVSLEETVL